MPDRAPLPCLALAAALLGGAPAASAGNAVAIEELTLVYEGVAFRAERPGDPPHAFLRAPGRPWLGVDLLSEPGAPAPVAVEITPTLDSDLAPGFTVQALGADAVLRASFFHAGDGSVTHPPHVLRERQTQALVAPVSSRGIAVDPSDPSGNTVYAFDSFARADGGTDALATRFFKSAGGLKYETEVVDYREGGVTSLVIPVPFHPAVEPLAADFAPHPDGSVHGVFASPAGLELFDMIDPQGQVVASSPLAVLPAPTGFDPGSVHLGIIAIGIGLVETPVPSVSFQAGDELFLYAYDGAGGFAPIAQQPIAAGATGLIEEEGIFYAVLDGTSNTILVGELGAPPDTRIELADVAETLDETSPPMPARFESADGDARLDVFDGWAPAPGASATGISAAGDAVLRSVADIDLAHTADGRRGAVLRGVLPNQAVAGRYEASGALARSFVLDVEQLPFGDPFDPAVDAAVVDSVNADVATYAPFVFDDTDGSETIALLGVTTNLELFDWVRASSYRAEVVPWLWLLPGAAASIEHTGGAVGPRSLRAELHESEEEQTALAATPTSFVAATNDVAHADVQAFAADAAAALGGAVEVVAFASAVSRTEAVDKDETITIHAILPESSLGDDLHLFWGGGLSGTGVVGVTIAVENDETHWVGVDRQYHGSVSTLGAALAGTTEPLLADQAWNRVAVTFEGDPDQPIVLGVAGVGIVRVVPEPGATGLGAAALIALFARQRLRGA